MSLNLLWISQYAPVSKDYEAGNRTLYYYFKAISSDKDIKIRLVAFVKNDLKDLTIEENKDLDCDFIYFYSSSSFKNKLKRITNIESRYNPYNRYGGMISNYYANELKKILRRLKNNKYKPDVVILDWTSMVLFAKYVKRLFPQAKIISSEVDVAFVGYERRANYHKGIKRLIWNIKYKHEKKLELNSLLISDLVLPQNPDNKMLLEQEGVPPEKINWLVPYYEDFSLSSHKTINKDIIFYGSMPRAENFLSAIWFIDNVMPLLKDEDVRFVVVGNRPPTQLKERENDRVIITGFVDSIAPFFSSSLCFVAPLVLGAGIKVKVLEALSSGIPVLTNDIGIEGIDVKNGVDYYHCEAPEEYAESIKLLLKGTSDIGVNAKHKVSKNYSYSKCKDDYIRWIKELCCFKGGSNG